MSEKKTLPTIAKMGLLFIFCGIITGATYGTIIAPPGFYGRPVIVGGPFIDKLMMDMVNALHEAGLPNLLDGGVDLEFLVPVRVGDILVSLPRVTDMMVREGKEGRKMAFSVIETTYHNQNSQLAIKARQTLISLPAA